MALEPKKTLNESLSVVQTDGLFKGRKQVKEVLESSSLETSNPLNKDELWRLNHVCAKLRHHLSRLKRKTWATTKSMERLQMHCDLFIAYQNKYTWNF